MIQDSRISDWSQGEDAIFGALYYRAGALADIGRYAACRVKRPILCSLTAAVALGVLFGSPIWTTNASAEIVEPVATYAFNENSGKTAHDSAGEDDGVLDGFSAGWNEEGKYGPSIDLHGLEDRLTIPGGSFEFKGGFTIEAWIWQWGEEPSSPLFTKEDVNAEEEEAPFSYALYAGGEAGVSGIVRVNEEEPFEIAGSEELPSPAWSHIALTHDGETARLYLNGDLVASEEAPLVTESEGPLQIGGNLAPGDEFNGRVDEVRLYDQAISEEQIESDMATPLPSEPSIVAFGPLVEAASEELVSPDSATSLIAGAYKAKIARIDVLLDGEVEQEFDPATITDEEGGEFCFEEYCSIDLVFDAAIGRTVAPGPHLFEIRAVTDKGTSAVISHEVVLDPSGPVLTLSGPLLADNGIPMSKPSEALELEATDGEGEFVAGLAEVTVTVDDEPVEVEGLECEWWECVQPAAGTVVYDEAEWGSGPRTVVVKAIDRAGNEESQTVKVNSTIQSVEPPCPPVEQTVSETEESVSAAAAREQLASALPSTVAANDLAGAGDPENQLDPALTVRGAETTNEALVASGSSQGGRIVGKPGGGFTIGQSACLVPLETTIEETGPHALPNAAGAVFANSAPGTDTLVRPTVLGATVVQHLRGSEAPSSFSWQVALPPSEELVELSDGSAAIVSKAGDDTEPIETPVPNPEAEAPAAIPDVETQLEAGIYDLQRGEELSDRKVLAVIPMPYGVDIEGESLSASMTVDPETDVITAEAPLSATALVVRTESAPDPAATCAVVMQSDPALYERVCTDWDESTESAYAFGLDWSPEGFLVFTGFENMDDYREPGPGETVFAPEETALYKVNPDGSDLELLLSEPYVALGPPSVWPDGSLITLRGCTMVPVECGIITVNDDGTEPKMVASFPDGDISFNPSFNSAGNRIYYYRNNPWRQLYSMKLDGTDHKQLTDLTFGIFGWKRAASASPDGESIAIGIENNIYSMPVAAEKLKLGSMTALAGSTESSAPAYSPDSSHIAYSFGSEMSGQPSGVYEMAANGAGKHLVASTPFPHPERATYPVYSPDESEVAFTKAGVIYRANVAEGGVQLVSDGAARVSLVELMEGLGSEAVEEAEAAEEELGKYHVEFSYEIPTPKDAEFEFCRSSALHAKECIYFNDDRKLAQEMRDKVFTNRDIFDDNTRANAFLHGFWTTLMVRDATLIGAEKNDGLTFAQLHEEEPYDLAAKMDLLNDLVGSQYFMTEGLEAEAWKTELQVCEALRIKGGNAIFIGSRADALRWALKRVKEEEYFLLRLVFRVARSTQGHKPIIKPNGRTCAATW